MYARHSLYNECEAQSRNGGLVHLTVASVYLELGGFRRCLEVGSSNDDDDCEYFYPYILPGGDLIFFSFFSTSFFSFLIFFSSHNRTHMWNCRVYKVPIK